MGNYRQEKRGKDSSVRRKKRSLRQADDFDEMLDLENENNLTVLRGFRIKPNKHKKWNKEGNRYE